MSATDNRPQNLNFLSQIGFKFEIARAPNFNYFIQKVLFPGVTLPTVFKPNPFVRDTVPGDQITYDSLTIQFKLDEDLRGYFEMYDWITALGKPESFEQSAAIYRKPKYDINSVYSTGALTILNNKMMPNIQVTFLDMVPQRLSGFTLETDSNDVNYISASLELNYLLYKYEYVT
jgi:hypothetical protein